MMRDMIGVSLRPLASTRRFAPLALGAVLAAVGLSACQTMPESGPPTRAVMDGAKSQPGLNYYLIRATPQVMQIINERRTQDLAKVFANGQPAPNRPLFSQMVTDTVSPTPIGCIGAGLWSANTGPSSRPRRALMIETMAGETGTR